MTFVFNDRQSSFTIENMPVWTGMKTSPGVDHTHDFIMAAPQTGPIIQIMDDDFSSEVIDRYSHDTYAFITNPPGLSEWSTSMAENKMANLAQWIGSKKPNSVLEIGGGNTWFGEVFCDRYNPANYTCIDPTIQHKSIDKRIAIFRDYFPSPKLGSQQFDLILAYSVLEHVPDPALLLKGIRNYLSKNGMAVICVPDCQRQLITGDINGLIHEHITYFTAETLKQELDRAGLDIIEISSKNDLFSVLVQQKPPVLETLHLINDKEHFDRAAKSYGYLFNDFAHHIRSLMKSGTKIAFHGATQGLNTFIHVTGIGQFSFDLYDGDQTKAGKFLPAYSKPVKHVTETDYTSHDILIISAMSFFDVIETQALKAGYRPEQLLPMTVDHLQKDLIS